jgi:CrcB protein
VVEAQVRPDVRTRLAVVLGGAVGVLLRAGVSALVPATGRGLPLGTLTANLTGALLLGALVAVAEREGLHASPTVVLAGTGVLGAYTTFSTFAVEVLDLLGPDPVLAVTYALVSVVGGLAAAAAGRWLASGRAVAP